MPKKKKLQPTEIVPFAAGVLAVVGYVWWRARQDAAPATTPVPYGVLGAGAARIDDGWAIGVGGGSGTSSPAIPTTPGDQIDQGGGELPGFDEPVDPYPSIDNPAARLPMESYPETPYVDAPRGDRGGEPVIVAPESLIPYRGDRGGSEPVSVIPYRGDRGGNPVTPQPFAPHTPSIDDRLPGGGGSQPFAPHRPTEPRKPAASGSRGR